MTFLSYAISNLICQAIKPLDPKDRPFSSCTFFPAQRSFLSLPHPALLHRPKTKISHKPSYEQRLPVSAPGGKKSWKGDNKGKGKYGAVGGSVGPGDVQVKLIVDPKAFQPPGTVGR